MTNPFNPLQAYAQHILSQPLMGLRPPHRAIFASLEGTEGTVTSVVIDRQGQYQTELFLVPPSVKEIRQHTHPGVDSFEYHLAGDYEFIIDGYSHPNIVRGEACGERSILGQVDASTWHGGHFDHGGSFLSFQHWLQGTPPTSVGDSFIETGAPPNTSGK